MIYIDITLWIKILIILNCVYHSQMRSLLLTALQKHCLVPDQIDYVVSTHGHSDHIGNNNLFLQAKHIVGFSVNFNDKYTLHPFDKGIVLYIFFIIKIGKIVSAYQPVHFGVVLTSMPRGLIYNVPRTKEP